MDIKKAIVSAVVLYALIFLLASALLNTITGVVFGAVMVIGGAVLTFLVAKYYYFKGMDAKNPVMEGLKLGIVLVVVAFLIEVPVMVYGFAATQGWGYFKSWNIMLGYLLMLVVPIFAAYKKK